MISADGHSLRKANFEAGKLSLHHPAFVGVTQQRSQLFQRHRVVQR